MRQRVAKERHTDTVRMWFKQFDKNRSGMLEHGELQALLARVEDPSALGPLLQPLQALAAAAPPAAAVPAAPQPAGQAAAGAGAAPRPAVPAAAAGLGAAPSPEAAAPERDRLERRLRAAGCSASLRLPRLPSRKLALLPASEISALASPVRYSARAL